MTNWLKRCCVACAFVLMADNAVAEVDVAATIAPVHSLASMVLKGVGEPALIVKPGASPHDYAMKPSDAKSLDEADIIFWGGDALEPWMAKAIETLAADAMVVELGAVEGVKKLAVRASGVWDSHDHAGHGDDVDDHEEHDRDHRYDPHLWLDPENAKVWLQTMAAALAEVDPGNAQLYRANAEQSADRLTTITSSIEAKLAPVKAKPYIVFHDAYQYFERRFDLHAVGSVSFERRRSSERCAADRDTSTGPGEQRRLRLRRTAIRAEIAGYGDRGECCQERNSRSDRRGSGARKRAVSRLDGALGGVLDRLSILIYRLAKSHPLTATSSTVLPLLSGEGDGDLAERPGPEITFGRVVHVSCWATIRRRSPRRRRTGGGRRSSAIPSHRYTRSCLLEAPGDWHRRRCRV